MEIICTQILPSEIWELTFSEAIREPFYQAASALLFFVLLLLYLLRKFRRELILAFSDEEGAVQITPNALHELVRKSCEDLDAVHSPTTKIVHLRGKLRLHVRLRVDADCNIKETRSALRERVELVLVGNLGLKNFGGVDVVVKGFRENK
ncbi:MAG: hypothetical protein O3A82_10220 [Verrucomicrobia bacterium]|jgi:hypothetical protein|nr:hypothetical protein [Verrucomicrobiota bacterium]MDA1047288.1 hypothetical protein [Verrucomicrobiota bacterium]